MKTNYYKAFDEDKKKFYTDAKYVQSAMIQGWNKFCFTGGIVEVKAKLPGDPKIGGLWPASEFDIAIAVFFPCRCVDAMPSIRFCARAACAGIPLLSPIYFSPLSSCSSCSSP